MTGTSRARRAALAGAASALALVLTGCATPTATPTRTPTGTAPAETPPAETNDRDYVFDRIRERSQTASSVAFDRVLADWLPNQRYVIDGEAAKPLGQGVVIGDTPGRAYAADAADESIELAFDSPRALWRTLDVVVAVEQSWGGFAGRREVRVGLSIDATTDTARMVDGLEEVDSAIVVVSSRGFFRYDDQLLSVARNGALLGEVVDGSTITFPGLETAQDPQGYVRGTETVSTLREEAKRAKTPLVVSNGNRR